MLTHGANPGLVSHFVKQALLTIARDIGRRHLAPSTREGWAQLARAPRRQGDPHRRARHPGGQLDKRPGEFVNTWSIDGFVGEGCQPAELGWGTHERSLPADARRHDFGCDAAVYLLRPGAATRVRSWTPLEGPFHGFLITHNEFDLDRRLPDTLHVSRLPFDGDRAHSPLQGCNGTCSAAAKQVEQQTTRLSCYVQILARAASGFGDGCRQALFSWLLAGMSQTSLNC